MSETITHGQLEDLLLSFGFERFEVPNSHRLFTHVETGAELMLPCFPPDRAAHDFHWSKVRGVLDDYNFLARSQFFDRVREYSSAA
jgi:hypothetical protein